MKQVLFIVGFLCAMLLLTPSEGFSTVTHAVDSTAQSQLNEINHSSHQKQVQVELSNELKECTCLIPRGQQVSNNSFIQRASRASLKLVHIIQLKEQNILRKVLETVSTDQTINYFSLLSRSGYHIYALRKIII